ncbi:hypothetical protein FAI40_04140 [Acetobacteraceae bacterium]|nr:hypothetical protein FAI40_04140 [Acetobacteraceae bacterium]
MKKQMTSFPALLKYSLLLPMLSVFAVGVPQAFADVGDNLQAAIQANLPEGEDIHQFLQISQTQAWISTTYHTPDALQIGTCSLSYVKIDASKGSPRLSNSLSFLANGEANKLQAFNQTWSLPVESEGQMTLRNTKYKQTFGMMALSPYTIEGTVETQGMENLLNALGKRPEVWLSFSSGETQSLPTIRLVPLINDFKKCASSNHFGDFGGPLDPRANLGDNPF